MSNATVTTLHDGRNKVYHIFLEGDGTEFNDEVLIDSGKTLTAEAITWSFDGFTGVLKFEYLVDDTLVWILTPDACGHVDFRRFGGLKDRSPSLDATGRVLLDTSGIGTKKGSIVLEMKA